MSFILNNNSDHRPTIRFNKKEYLIEVFSTKSGATFVSAQVGKSGQFIKLLMPQEVLFNAEEVEIEESEDDKLKRILSSKLDDNDTTDDEYQPDVEIRQNYIWKDLMPYCGKMIVLFASSEIVSKCAASYEGAELFREMVTAGMAYLNISKLKHELTTEMQADAISDTNIGTDGTDSTDSANDQLHAEYIKNFHDILIHAKNLLEQNLKSNPTS